MQKSLGVISITNPGVPVRLTSNLPNPEGPFYVHAYVIQRLETSSGNIYVGLSSEDDRSTLSQILCILSSTQPSFSAGIGIQLNPLDLSRVYIDGDYEGDAIIASALVA